MKKERKERKKERKSEFPKEEKKSIENTFNAFIEEPSRFKTMAKLYMVQELNFIALKVITGLSWKKLLSNIAKLEEKGYVEVKKKLRGEIFHSWANLTPNGIMAISKLPEVK